MIITKLAQAAHSLFSRVMKFSRDGGAIASLHVTQLLTCKEFPPLHLMAVAYFAFAVCLCEDGGWLYLLSNVHPLR